MYVSVSVCQLPHKLLIFWLFSTKSDRDGTTMGISRASRFNENSQVSGEGRSCQGQAGGKGLEGQLNGSYVGCRAGEDRLRCSRHAGSDVLTCVVLNVALGKMQNVEPQTIL